MSAVVVAAAGQEHLQGALDALAPAARKRVLKPALTKGAEHIAEAARNLVPFKTGRLYRSIRVREGRTRTAQEVKVLVMSGRDLFGGEEFYGAFVELGHGVGKRSSQTDSFQKGLRKRERSVVRRAEIYAARDAGLGRKRVRPYPFLRPAAEQTGDAVARSIEAEVLRGIQSEAAKLGQKARQAVSRAFRQSMGGR